MNHEPYSKDTWYKEPKYALNKRIYLLNTKRFALVALSISVDEAENINRGKQAMNTIHDYVAVDILVCRNRKTAFELFFLNVENLECLLNVKTLPSQ